MPKRFISHMSTRLLLSQLFSVFIILSTSSYLQADVIYLKDGTQLETDKVWEENGLVRFYLKGTNNIIITYSKEIVDRVEVGPPYSFDDQSDPINQTQAISPPSSSMARQPVSEKNLPPDNKTDTEEKMSTHQAPIVSEKTTPVESQPPDTSTSSEVLKNSHFMFGAEYNGIPFYDPRRERRYQTGKGSYYSSLEEAIEALAKQFNQTTGWIKQHIGNTNDLGEIYRNLNRPTIQHQTETAQSPSGFVSGIQFYNPRRAYKYWISDTGKYNSYEAAIAALAQQFNSTPEWITTHMGDTNDLGEIHQNLMESKIRESGPKKQ